MKSIDSTALMQECMFRTSRSGGHGGQRVNKVETRVELIFDIDKSALFTEEEKEILYKKLSARLTQDGLLQLSCEKERSQYRNKQLVIERLVLILEKAVAPVKPRKKTKPTTSAIEKRLRDKQALAQKKTNRKIASCSSGVKE